MDKYKVQQLIIDHRAMDEQTYRDLFERIESKEQQLNAEYIEILKRERGMGRSKYIVLFKINAK